MQLYQNNVHMTTNTWRSALAASTEHNHITFTNPPSVMQPICFVSFVNMSLVR